MANTTSPLSQKVRQKQIMILGAVGLGIMAIAVVSAFFVTEKPKSVAKPTVTTTRNLIDATGDTADREKWRERSAQDIEKLRHQMAEQNKINADLVRMIEEAKKRDEGAVEKSADSGGAPVPPPAALPALPGGQLLPGQPVPQAGVAGTPVIGGPGMVMPGGVVDYGRGASGLSAPAVASVKFDAPPAATQKASTPQARSTAGGRPYRSGPNGERIYLEDAAVNGEFEKTYIPAGAFARAVVLGGVDAPTGGQAQQNPHPILLRILGDARLPGGARVNMKDCVATADAVGDLSSERVQIRLQRLSCRIGVDKMADISVKGHLDGEDGKAGMRARLVTKTGQVLSNALLTGTLSSLGTAIQATSQTTTGTALGTTVTTGDSTSDVVRYAAGGGVSKAFDRLANYYITLADKLFPVLELDSMRVGDIVFTQGFTLEAL
jgi:conjugal transfer pilus assembly protein TraB